MNDEITDTTKHRATYLAESPSASNDVAGLLTCRYVYYQLARLLKVRNEFASQLHNTIHLTTMTSFLSAVNTRSDVFKMCEEVGGGGFYVQKPRV